MPLVVICGHPCSGKSNVAKLIEEDCKEKGIEVVLVDEEALYLTRDASYKGKLNGQRSNLKTLFCLIGIPILRPGSYCRCPQRKEYSWASSVCRRSQY